MMKNDPISKIMRRVYMIWVARRVVNPFTIKVAGLLAILAWMRQYVSIKHVLYNSPSFANPAAAFSFFSHAFWNTGRVVEALTIALIVVGLFLVRDAIKRFSMAEEYRAIVGV